MNYLDIHTHVCQSREGVTAIYNYLLTESAEIVQIESNWISIGLHPWYVTDQNLKPLLALLEVNATNANVKLIGECGLDRLRGMPLDWQMKVFEQQLDVAEQVRKPLIIHCVRAFDLLLDLVKKRKPGIPLILHGFNRNAGLANQLTDQGIFLSFGDALLKTTSGPSQVINMLDIPFFLETDDGRANIEEIYGRAAFLLEISVESLKERIFAAWKKIGLI